MIHRGASSQQDNYSIFDAPAHQKNDQKQNPKTPAYDIIIAKLQATKKLHAQTEM